jgi:hypothetical protein
VSNLSKKTAKIRISAQIVTWADMGRLTRIEMQVCVPVKKKKEMQVCDLQLVTGHVNNNKKRLRLLHDTY